MAYAAASHDGYLGSAPGVCGGSGIRRELRWPVKYDQSGSAIAAARGNERTPRPATSGNRLCAAIPAPAPRIFADDGHVAFVEIVERAFDASPLQLL
jgi:hypothetical protein